MITPEEKRIISKTLSAPLLLEGAISPEDLLKFKIKVFSGWRNTRTYPGGKILFDEFTEDLKKYIKDCLMEYFPNSIPTLDVSWNDVKIFGNIYITTSEYGLHTDAFSEYVIKNKKSFYVKNIVIPLDVCGFELENPYINNLILMKNRLIDYDKTFQKNTNREWYVKYQKNITDYSNIDWIDETGQSMNLDPNKMYITQEQYNNHLSHIEEKQILDSFIIDKAFKFNPGNIIVHDTTQAHITGHMKYNMSEVTNKAGIRLSLRVPLDAI